MENVDNGVHHGPLISSEQTPDKNEYATPGEVWRPLADCVGGFDLDPCSGAEPTPIAPKRYTKDDNGLEQPWCGDVFVNPPWSNKGDGSAKDEWLTKARSEILRDEVSSVVVLLPGDTSTGWFHKHVLAAEAICFYGPGRLSFVGGDRNPSFPLFIVAYGERADAYRGTLTEFGEVIDGRRVYQQTRQMRFSVGGE